MADEREKALRYLAHQHRDDIVEGSERPVQPRVLGQIISVRLPGDLAAALRTFAEARGQTVSDVLRRAAMALVGTPIGWQCDHMNITACGVAIGPVTGLCGCQLRPVYDISELATS